MSLPQIRPDIAQHSTYGTVASLFGLVLAYVLSLAGAHVSQRYCTAACVVGAAAGKEAWDAATGNGKPELLDFAATVFGGLPGILGAAE